MKPKEVEVGSVDSRILITALEVQAVIIEEGKENGIEPQKVTDMINKLASGLAVFFYDPNKKGIGYAELIFLDENNVAIKDLIIAKKVQHAFTPTHGVVFCVQKAQAQYPGCTICFFPKDNEELDIMNSLTAIGAQPMTPDQISKIHLNNHSIIEHIFGWDLTQVKVPEFPI
ncbi:hypothetical protein A3A66_04620 [Microgenomates group bacterium RIFCSPLOWO2_01_FULL_46_13]|nr:MAG: hypothetical protein A2783_05095 [Microgenomates group bacterium RIFCSPHIGHO2_01_FULL_45_11]OGV94252.1 MAG: hypothetical protein A3A66_04620 [Microgenomates group bacterium RIFCSPLOWO2_01_FULL_46_13]